VKNILDLISISDVSLVAIASNLFWLILFFGVTFLFRNELRLVLRSLARFKIAGAVFEIKEGPATLEYYDIFSKILGEILAKRNSADKFYDYISPSTARQLAQFVLKYAKAVPEDANDIEILKNVALLVGRKGNTVAAISLYDALLKQTPDDLDLLYLKGRMLRESGIRNNIVESERIYKELADKYQNHAGIWYGLARSRSLLEQLEPSLEALTRALELGYWWRADNGAEMLERPELEKAAGRR
jgi:tetratricopeptide (TPR) repeat protein